MCLGSFLMGLRWPSSQAAGLNLQIIKKCLGHHGLLISHGWHKQTPLAGLWGCLQRSAASHPSMSMAMLRSLYSSVCGFFSTCHEHNNSLKALTKSSTVKLWILTDKTETPDDAESLWSQCFLSPDMKLCRRQLLCNFQNSAVKTHTCFRHIACFLCLFESYSFVCLFFKQDVQDTKCIVLHNSKIKWKFDYHISLRAFTSFTWLAFGLCK